MAEPITTPRRSTQLGFLVATGLAMVMAVATTEACSGSSGSNLTAPAADAGSGSAIASGDGGTTTTYTLDDVCDKTASVVCQLREPCCTAYGGAGFDQGACITHETTECGSDVAAARAGTETFHPERIDDCVAKIKQIYAATCALTIDQILSYADDLRTCQIFTGTKAEGASCARDSECQADDVGVSISCDDDSHTCHSTRILGEGAACSFADGLPTICGQGFYCDAAATDAGTLAGVCKKKTAIGQACTKPLECGLGNYCATQGGTCAAGKPGGASCQIGLECASFVCQNASDGGTDGPGTCAALKSIVKPEECVGP